MLLYTRRSSEWTGLKGRIGGWYLASPLRRLSELLVLGDLRPRVLRALELEGNETVVDVGCGSAFFTLPVAARLPGGRLIGIDLSSEMLDVARHRLRRWRLDGRVELRKGDALALELADACADVAISNGIWHELVRPEVAAAELHRILKPGGRVVISDFRDTWLGRRIGASHAAGDHGPFSPKRLSEVLGEAGFTAIEAQPVGNWVLAWGIKPGATHYGEAS